MDGFCKILHLFFLQPSGFVHRVGRPSPSVASILNGKANRTEIHSSGKPEANSLSRPSKPPFRLLPRATVMAAF